MFDPVTVIIDQDMIKFTPDGKIAVLDAIASLGTEQDTPALWRHLLALHPDLNGVCESYSFSNQAPVLVANGDGWEKIQSALFDFLFLETAFE